MRLADREEERKYTELNCAGHKKVALLNKNEVNYHTKSGHVIPVLVKELLP